MNNWIETPAVPLKLSDLAGKSFLVTGSSMGIGASVVECLLENEATVFGLARSPGRIKHPRFRQILCDLSSSTEIESSCREIGAATSSLDGVVNIAGADPKYGLEEMSFEAWDQLIDLNLRAYYFVIKQSLPLLRKGTDSSVVNVSSINYRLGIPGRAAYSATKAGILGLTSGLSRELGAERIRINTISPGWIFTERQVEEYFSGCAKERYLGYLAERQSLKLQIQSRDVANHVLFYLSSVSRASVGHNCVVDGGWLLE